MARQPVDVHTRVATEADDTPSRRAGAIGVALALALVAASMAWALVLVGRGVDLHLSGGPPLTGRYEPRFPAAALAPVLFAACVLWRAPALARRLSWRPLLGVATASAGIWAVLLAGTDGIGAVGLPLTSPFEYLRDVGRFHDLNEFLGTFTAHVSEESAGFLAVAAARQGWSGDGLALLGGILLGLGLFLSYGLVLMGLLAVAAVAVRRRLRPLVVGAVGVWSVVGWWAGPLGSVVILPAAAAAAVLLAIGSNLWKGRGGAYLPAVRGLAAAGRGRVARPRSARLA